MNKQIYKCQGIVLNALPYQVYDQILTLYTLEEGLLKVIVKRALISKEGKGAKSAPLTQLELVYTKGRSEIYKCQELSVLNHNLSLRKDLSTLEAACDLGRALLASQMIHAPAPDLYNLFLYYLEKIAIVPIPAVLVASFQLKILRHDGVLGLSTAVTPEETAILSELAFGRSLERIAAVDLAPILKQKIEKQFVLHCSGQS